jgi:hypothetical protein
MDTEIFHVEASHTGLVAVALLAVAAATTSMRSHSHSTEPAIGSPGISFEELTVDINKLPTQEFDDQSLVFSRGTGG